jgi:hypothetical protein
LPDQGLRPQNMGIMRQQLGAFSQTMTSARMGATNRSAADRLAPARKSPWP